MTARAAKLAFLVVQLVSAARTPAPVLSRRLAHCGVAAGHREGIWRRGIAGRGRAHNPSLPRWPIEFATTKDVAMQVRDGLAGVGSVVENQAKPAWRQAQFLRHNGSFEH